MHTAKYRSLLKKLCHSDPSQRKKAAEDLSAGDERAIYPLIKALRDENYGVQDAAMRSLMSLKGEATAYMLLPLLREDAFLRNTALVILRETGKEAVPLLISLLRDKDDDIRKFALDLIHDIRYCTYPDKLILMLREDPNANVRAAAAKTLGALRYKKALPDLMNALQDDEWVCFSALEALSEMNDDSATDSIISLLGNSSEAVRLGAIEALGRIGSSRAEKPLTEHIAEADDMEKKAAIVSLLYIGSVPSLPEISDYLIEMLNEGDWEEKTIALKGLVCLKDRKSIYHMINVAGSYDISIPDNEEKVLTIKEAVRSFGCSDDLIDILKDKRLKFRGRSIIIDIIGDLQCTEAVPFLIDLMKYEYRDGKRAIMESLSKISDDGARDFLIDSINEHDSHVRKTAVISLGKMRAMSAFEPLMQMLTKEIYNDVIDEFIIALLNINRDLFLSRIEEFDENIREAARRVISDLSPEIQC